jgi:DNA-directed RNA polymerase subunit RPC12/RpoP
MSSIDIKSGSEGPRHDPYSYLEITVTRESGATVCMHAGLIVWIEVNGIRSDCSYETAAGIFEDIAGISLEVAEKVHERRATQCSECGSRDLREQSGYPGETLYFCERCDAMVHYHFNEAAII